MASLSTVSVTPKPLMLKDLIRDDPDFELALDDTDGTTLRGLFRICKLSSVVNTVRLLPFFSSSSPSSARKIFGRCFWKKRQRPVALNESENHCIISTLQETDISPRRLLIRDIIRSESYLEEMRGCRSSSIDDSANDCLLLDFTASDDSVSTFQPVDIANNGTSTVGPSTVRNSDSVVTSNNRHHDDQKEDKTQTTQCSCQCHQYEEDKDQFSPVSVMDFLSEEDEEPAQSPCPSPLRPNSSFHYDIVKFENASQHLLKQIGRFEILAKIEEEEGGRKLLKKTRTEVKCNDKLLLDFFVQEIKERNRTEEDLLSTAREWIEMSSGGTGRDDEVELDMKEIESEMRLTCIHVAERENITSDVEYGVFVSLIDDLLLDLMDF